MTRAGLSAALVASLALLGPGLAGCATKLTAKDGVQLMKAAHDNGCSGSVVLDVRGSTGQLGGSASGQFTLNGQCTGQAPPKPGLATGQVVAPGGPPPPPAVVFTPQT